MSHCNAVELAGPAFPPDARTYEPIPGRPEGKKKQTRSQEIVGLFL